MTTPTPAQIEADNKRLRAALSDMVEITKRNSSPEIILAAIRTCAAHALTAAAQVGPTSKCIAEHMGGKRCVGRCMDPKDCTGDPLPAAQVGEPPTNQKDLSRYIQSIGRAIEAATIERCAQVAETWTKDDFDLPAAIRKLKDEK